MNTPCAFDKKTFRFVGTPLQQAKCLLRKVLPLANVADTPATLPKTLESLIAQPVDVSTAAFAGYLKAKGIAPTAIGGALDKPLSQTNGKVAPATHAQYFVIHDTSINFKKGAFTAATAIFPDTINTAAWTGNDLSSAVGMQTHVFINRLGSSANANEYSKPLVATKREGREYAGDPAAMEGLFLHHELAQPRLNNKSGIDEFSPEPGFTEAQYERLAVCYVAASIRGGAWLIPVFHGVLDLKIKNGHDDPQHFELSAWSAALDRVRAEVLGTVLGSSVPVPAPAVVEEVLMTPAFQGDSLLEAIISGHGELGKGPQRLDAVAKIQRGLNLLSASHPEYAIDLGQGNVHSGYYGTKTEAAVYEFQVDQGLPKTGIINPATLHALDAALSQLAAGAPPVPPPPAPVAVAGVAGLAPGATPVGAPTLWKTGAGFAQDKKVPSKGWAKTSGITGSSQRYSDGSVIMSGSEVLDARRLTTQYPSVTATQSRHVKDGTHTIQQAGYCRSGRALPPALFMEQHSGLTGANIMPGYSTQFGKSDDMDEGTGSEGFGITQTSSEVCGCSVKASILVQWFGKNYLKDPMLLTSLVEVYYPVTHRYARVPLTDVGPSETVKAKIDLTWAVDQFLGTDGGDDVFFRLIKQ